MATLSGSKQAEEISKGTLTENRKRKMVASSAEGGEGAHSSREDKKAASNTVGTSSDAATAPLSAQAKEDAKKSEQSTSEQPGEGEDKRVLEIPMNSFDFSFLTNKMRRVELPEKYEHLPTFVWRFSKDGPALVVPGTPPALVAWEGGHLRADRKSPASPAHLLDRVRSPESSDEPDLRARTVCSFTYISLVLIHNQASRCLRELNLQVNGIEAPGQLSHDQLMFGQSTK